MGAVAPCTLRRCERPGNGPQPTVERKLAHRGVAGQAARWDLVGGREQRKSDREVESRALLAEVGGREVDRDPVERPIELGRGDAAADAFLGLLAGAVGEPDDREGGSATLQVRLDLDPARVEADEGVGDRSRKNVAILGDGTEPIVTSL
jgi:hypothetical protein